LVEQLARTAAAAVRARQQAIESGGPGNLNGIVIELELSNAGAIVDVTSHLSWRSMIRDAT
jgi:hypothetical protein